MTKLLIPTIESPSQNLARAIEVFRPIFTHIAQGAIGREQDRALPREAIASLTQAKFGTLRVPVAHGGFGLSLVETGHVLLELAIADTNIVQALRAHFAFVEDRLASADVESQVTWFARFVAGEIFGNGWTEVGSVKIGDVITKLSDTSDGPRINGEKYYSTGSIFADWIDTYAQHETTGEFVIAAVDAKRGVAISDNWDGFGQTTTGSGTLVYTDATVAEVIPFGARFRYQTAYYQWVLLLVQAGAALAAVQQASELVHKRTRIFSHGNASSFGEDPQILQVVGDAAANAYAAAALIAPVSAALDATYATAVELNAVAQDVGESPASSVWKYTIEGADTSELSDVVQAALFADREANEAAELHSAIAQVAIGPLAAQATNTILDSLGASGTSTSQALDRHWRNARTAASHNPRVFKSRIVGDYTVNDVKPPYVWGIGAGPKQGAAVDSAAVDSAAVHSTAAAATVAAAK